MALAAILLGLLLTAGACNPQTGPTQDRGGVNCDASTPLSNCAPVDEIRDIDWVMIERNANDAPNLVVSCVAGLGYTSGTTGRAQGDGGTAGAAQIVRDPSWDPLCALHKRQTVTGAKP